MVCDKNGSRPECVAEQMAHIMTREAKRKKGRSVFYSLQPTSQWLEIKCPIMPHCTNKYLVLVQVVGPIFLPVFVYIYSKSKRKQKQKFLRAYFLSSVIPMHSVCSS